jgi:hypothetical protein
MMTKGSETPCAQVTEQLSCSKAASQAESAQQRSCAQATQQLGSGCVKSASEGPKVKAVQLSCYQAAQQLSCVQASEQLSIVESSPEAPKVKALQQLMVSGTEDAPQTPKTPAALRSCPWAAQQLTTETSDHGLESKTSKTKTTTNLKMISKAGSPQRPQAQDYVSTQRRSSCSSQTSQRSSYGAAEAQRSSATAANSGCSTVPKARSLQAGNSLRTLQKGEGCGARRCALHCAAR